MEMFTEGIRLLSLLAFSHYFFLWALKKFLEE